MFEHIKEIIEQTLEKNPNANECSLYYLDYLHEKIRIEDVQSLASELANIPELNMFHEHNQIFGRSGHEASLPQLAQWLIVRASAVGSDQSIDELVTYIDADDVDVLALMALSDVHYDEKFEFQNGVTICNIEFLPNSEIANRFSNSRWSSVYPLPSVHTVLLSSYPQKVIHEPQDSENQKKIKWPEVPFEKLNQTRLAISLARPINEGIQSLGVTTITRESTPILSPMSGWSVPPQKPPPMAPAIINIELTTADQLLGLMIAKKPDELAHINVAIERLNNYSSGISHIDSCVELRTALEAFFLSDGKSDRIRRSLGNRAAYFLGTDHVERTAISRTIKKAYDFTSKAVHTGRADHDPNRILDTSANHLRKAIIKSIRDGYPDWKCIDKLAAQKFELAIFLADNLERLAKKLAR